MAKFHIRAARLGDEDTVLALLRDLAVYERLEDKFTITRDVITRDYFSDRPLLNCDLAFADDAPVGVATWHWVYSSFAAARTLYLEDLFVRPENRGAGYGKALLEHLAQIAVQAKALRMEWSVLPWNAPSIAFYETLGAERMTDWLIYRLSGDSLQKLGAS